jgi:uncharacterized radical SAM superfamily Fe-S cluster-containing enzyme
MPKSRPYLYYDQVTSLCEHCLRRVEGKLVIQDDRVWLHKWCREHGKSKVLIATDVDYWRSSRETYIKPPEMPLRFNTSMEWGCPYDCGLCPDHMQHSCLTIVEITDHCNLSCPVCYADSGPHRTDYRSLEVVEKMLDAIVANEGEPDIVQISGGEPTTHPDFFSILDAAKRRPIRHLMLNTNGLRIADEEGFARRLAEYGPGIEVYLQFDSLRRDALITLRGADLRRIRKRALENLNEAGVSTTLVITVARGINDDELGTLIEFASRQSCVRGVTFQPIQFAGRTDGVGIKEQRLTLTEVRHKILEQSRLFEAADIIPVPCNPDALAMGYAIKSESGIAPLTRFISADALLAGPRNTIAFETDSDLKNKVFDVFSTGLGPDKQANGLATLLCCLPVVDAPQDITYQNVFRVVIMAFMDAVNFDVRVMKKSCVHLAQPDGRIIPFESFNLLYRDDRAKILAKRRIEADALLGRSASHVIPIGTNGGPS